MTADPTARTGLQPTHHRPAIPRDWPLALASRLGRATAALPIVALVPAMSFPPADTLHVRSLVHTALIMNGFAAIAAILMVGMWQLVAVHGCAGPSDFQRRTFATAFTTGVFAGTFSLTVDALLPHLPTVALHPQPFL